jgi:hypothetical protein
MMVLQYMNATVNIFTNYQQEENHFTNGLVALLDLSRYEHPEIASSFLRDLLGLTPNGEVEACRVLRGIDGTADAEICCGGCCVRFETKIRSGTLDTRQLRSHLKRLSRCQKRLKRLVLLTPDDGKSAYIRQFLAIDDRRILHLGWRTVYDWLEERACKSEGTIFSQLVRQFLDRIHDCVFEQDIAGVITKIAFGDFSQVYEDSYLQEMRRGEWDRWNTPREYKNLDGTGRKLLLYDRTREGITVEVEIKKVSRIPRRRNWCWQNLFVPGTLRVFRKPIPLFHIRSIPGFEGFGMYRRDRSAYRNITREQYRQLMEK